MFGLSGPIRPNQEDYTMRQERIETTGCDEVPAGVTASPQEEAVNEVSEDRREELKGILTLDAGKVESHLDGKVR